MRQRFSKLWALAAGLAIVQAVVHAAWVFPLWQKNFAPKQGSYEGLTSDQMLFAFAGFRELIAGILWVRADTFFDEGNFDAILPIIYLVTRLDPHQIDVYDTGMWHIAYNFTDEGSRSDRRYVPSAVALGIEGANNNPSTYELFYGTGWLYFHKIEDDYAEAVKWFEQAMTKNDVVTARRNILNNAYQRNGQVDKAVEYMFKVLEDSEAAVKADKEYAARQNRDTIENNLDNLLVRMAQRGEFARASGHYDGWDYDTKPPFDVGFSARVTVVEPKVIQVEGTWNVLPVGTRVRIVLRDSDYPDALPAELTWNQGTAIKLDPPKGLTFMQDQLFVKNQRFSREIDMSRDPNMYPFTKQKYLVEFYYNPRQAPAYIQDKFGWNGEGMTDKNFLNTQIRPGARVVYTTMELTREQLLRTGEWKEKVPIQQTKNFAGFGSKQLDDNVIKVPGILSEPGH
ncbi:MAG: hypothetical protein JSS66_04235 [Armatimonadetes bacterium]|nr:hypothetical protein [Armatimonadota bacterium]